MRILLVGEFSGIHWALAEGLRHLGHEVCVVSNGNGWKNYPRDIDLSRASDGKWDGVKYLARLLGVLPRLKGYDVVQFVNPCFLHLRPEKSLHIFRYLKRHNRHVFLGAFGTDHYYVKACMERQVYAYSDFKTGNTVRQSEENQAIINENLYGGTALATKEMARNSEAIIACLWEYYAAYMEEFPSTTTFIPLPIDTTSIVSRVREVPQKVNFFIGIQSQRHHIKGTDIMLPVVEEVCRRYPDQCYLTKAVDVPFVEYERLMDSADVQLDQLYAYTPSMNSLLAMAKGVIVCGGGEPQNYDILGEEELRPIINITPDPDQLYRQLVDIIEHKERIPELSRQSIAYVKKHHDYIRVAQRYVDTWLRFMQTDSQPL